MFRLFAQSTDTDQYLNDFNSKINELETHADKLDQVSATATALTLPLTIVAIVLSLAAIVGIWKMFEKAGQPGWKALVPVYNLVILFQIVGLSPWFLLVFVLALIPIVGWVALAILYVIFQYYVAKAFGRGVGTAALNSVAFYIGYPILGFGDARYMGPNGKGAPTVATTEATPSATPPTDSIPPKQ